jgi:hypothetical protein
MKWMLIFLFTVATINLYAQDSKEDAEREKKFRDKAAQAGKDTSKAYGWTQNIVTGVNLTQVSFKDWAQGGENALAYTLWLKGSAIQDMEMTNWTNAYRFAFGQTRLGNQGLRKTDDEIYFESLLIYKFGLYINPYAAATLRTQFAKGFMFDNLGNSTEVSKFFDPGYLTQSLGVAYKPVPEITTRFGVGLREVITSQFSSFYTDDPATPEVEKTKIDGGLESVTNVEWKFAENMAFSSNLELFDPFKSLDHILVRSDNAISAKVNKYVTVNFTVQLINDVRVSPLTQIKEGLAIGLSYTLL